jgi:predicted GH43/DUF377 family glycosyl hydrolase
VEDPRVTYLAALGLYVMTYTAFGPAGPRIAVAVARDLRHWQRSGLVRFAPYHGLDLSTLDNKDALLFPDPVPAPDGRPALALIHRPTFRGAPLGGLRERRPSMWLSYAPLDAIGADRPVVFGQHHLLAGPQQGWERLKVGGGTPPLRVGHTWLVLYHGVCGRSGAGGAPQQGMCYSAGALLLDARDPRRVLARSTQSLLAPAVPEECAGVVPRVVFPTGLDARSDGMLDVYYGMADSRIGVARLDLVDLMALTTARAA